MNLNNSLLMLVFCLICLTNRQIYNGNLFDKVKSLFSPLEQFDIITILPVWIFNYEFTITNLTITLIAVIVLGFVFFFFFLIKNCFQKAGKLYLKIFIWLLLELLMSK